MKIKKILERKVRNEFTELNDEAINKILEKRYKGWSNLSKKLLTNKYYLDQESNSKKSILDLMIETNENFMQIMNHEEYHFQDMIDELNSKKDMTSLNYDIVDELATSPATKRGIYQSLKVVEEIVKYMGYEPQNIIIEMAKGEEQSGRKSDKKKYIENLYDKCKKDIEDYQKLKNELNKYQKIDNQKLFLYFIQEGKSLYSGKSLNIEDLDSYEIDHIVPRTLVKDDSIDNKALVLRKENQIKAANLVLPREFRTEANILWWKKLKKCNLISSKKLYNLTRSHYEEKDIEGFINRQLVETRQITKHVANILKNLHKDTLITSLNANVSHNYREKYELFKFRDLNDYHHAHDAYLAAVLGLFKNRYLRKINYDEVKEFNQKSIESKEYKNLKYGYFINSFSFPVYDKKTGEVLFDTEELNKKIENTLYQNDILVSKKVEFRTGEFYNQTKSKKGNKGVGLKNNLDTKLYGSYTSLNPSYACVVKYQKKNKIEQRMIGIPIYIDQKENTNSGKKEEYIRQLLALNKNDNYEIIKDRIPFNTILNWGGQFCSLVGATDKVEVCNAKEFHIAKEYLKKWKYTLNKILNQKNIPKIKNEKDEWIPILTQEEYNRQVDDILEYIIKKIETEYVLYQNLISELKSNLYPLNELEISKKETVIMELFKLLKFNSTNANLKELNEKMSSNFGKKNGRIINHATILNNSVTGIYRSTDEF